MQEANGERTAGPGRRRLWAGAFIGLCLGLAAPVRSQEAATSVEDRLSRLEALNEQLLKQNETLQKQLSDSNARYERLEERLSPTEPPPLPSALLPEEYSEAPLLTPGGLPTTVPGPFPAANVSATAEAPAKNPHARFLVGEFDEATGQYVVVRPLEKDEHPFELRLDVWTQFRYTNFIPGRKIWINSAGDISQIRAQNSFEVMRNWILFTGYAMDPRLQYYWALFSSTAFNDTTLLGWVNYQFSKGFDLRAGNWLIPGSREWYNSYRYTQGADRTMATTYFRPNISPGIWAQGEPVEGFNYVFMLANSFNRFNQTANRLGANLTYSGSVWWEPNGAFGPGPADIEFHEKFTPRVGMSATVGRTYAQRTATTPANPEDTILRLSDGTPIFLANAIGPGTQLDAVDVQLLALDAAFKYRGFSLAAEVYLRWLNGFRFRTFGDPDAREFFTNGMYVQGGYFVVPEYLQLFARGSYVSGFYGYGSEIGGGVNWFVNGTRNWRFVLEALKVNGSPADNILTGYRAGESGTLLQAQMMIDF
jgi:hypothetical protein